MRTKSARRNNTMDINIKTFSETLGVKAKKFRKFLRSGKLAQAKKENGTWTLDTQNIADPYEFIKNLMNSTTRAPRIPGESRKEKEKVAKEEKYKAEDLDEVKSRWFGIKVDGGRELEVKAAIEHSKIDLLEEVFVPTQTVIKNGAERIQNILTKIVFIKTSHLKEVIPQIKDSSSKIKGFWMSMPDGKGNKQPEVIDIETVDSLKGLHNRTITDEQIHGFEINKQVEVISGPFKNTKGFIQGINGDIINVEMEILGRTLPLHIPSSQLRVIVE